MCFNSKSLRVLVRLRGTDDQSGLVADNLIDENLDFAVFSSAFETQLPTFRGEES